MKDKPNIVYILLDDMGYGDVSAFNPDAGFRTENFDLLASEGMRFTDAHATAAVCTPSRYSILTGRYNWRSCRKSGVNGGYDKSIIEPGRTTIAQMLRDNGYATSCIGKWHLGLDFATNDEYRKPEGFEIVDGIDFSKVIENGPTSFGFDYFICPQMSSFKGKIFEAWYLGILYCLMKAMDRYQNEACRHGRGCPAWE